MTSLEGIVVLHGNGPGAQPEHYNNSTDTWTPPTERWHVGWGPREGTPFIWLAQGGDNKCGIGGRPEAETLLIVTNNDPDIPGHTAPLEIPGTIGRDLGLYRWGHLEAGNITSHGFLKTSHLACAATSGFIALYNDLEPNGSNIHLGSTTRPFEGLVVKNLTVTGSLSGSLFDQSLNKADAVTFTNVTVAGTPQLQGNITTNGNITCHGALDVSHLRCDGGIFIALYSNLEPYDNGINLGSTTRQFENLYVKNLHVSGSGGGGTSDIRKGTVTTSSSGTLNVSFAPAFASGYTPTVTCTVNDSQGRAISAVITAKSNTGFSVKTFLISAVAHKHNIGEARKVASSNLSLYLLNAGTHNHQIDTNSYTRTTNAASASHEHTLDDYYAVSPTGNSAGGTTHNHTVSNAQYAHSTYNCTSTSHTHTYPDYYPVSPTQSAGDHSHTFIKPDYMRELAFRTQAGVSQVIGMTLTQYNDAETEVWTEDNNTSGNSPVGIAATVEYTAV